MQFFTAKIRFFNENTMQIDTDFMALSGKSFSDATAQIENYYGEDLDSVEITIINPDHGFILINEDLYKNINKEADV